MLVIGCLGDAMILGKYSQWVWPALAREWYFYSQLLVIAGGLPVVNA